MAGLLKLFQSVSFADGGGLSLRIQPAGVWPNTNLLIVDTSAGDAQWGGLAVGTQGQLLWIVNKIGGANLTLLVNSGLPVNGNEQFTGSGDLTIAAGDSLLIYYDTTIAGGGTPGRWIIGV